ncbi:hypothetical protein B0H16DRAFT_1484383 [Mycena metata]|uniref:Uncharacterized protein n=1 Tax=Mycena metata TaxID=1033252 RepID=A0AAD7GPY4_9AGAR|nr:hypothetical protein B0H16DRAFT_1484383 [Mycena metata]
MFPALSAPHRDVGMYGCRDFPLLIGGPRGKCDWENRGNESPCQPSTHWRPLGLVKCSTTQVARYQAQVHRFFRVCWPGKVWDVGQSMREENQSKVSAEDEEETHYPRGKHKTGRRPQSGPTGLIMPCEAVASKTSINIGGRIDCAEVPDAQDRERRTGGRTGPIFFAKIATKEKWVEGVAQVHTQSYAKNCGEISQASICPSLRSSMTQSLNRQSKNPEVTTIPGTKDGKKMAEGGEGGQIDANCVIDALSNFLGGLRH